MADLLFGNVKLLLHFDGSNGATTTTDNSSSAHVVTANGNAQLSTTREKFGTAASEHDGAGDFWSIPNSSDFSFGSGDFTVEGWLETDTVTGPHSVIGYANGSASNSNYSFYVLSNNAQLQGAIYQGTTGYTSTFSGLTVGTKVHWALERFGNNLTLYVGGVAGSVVNVTGVTANNPAGAALHIGQVQGFFAWDGMLDDIRITKGVARYQGAFTPPTAAFPDSYPLASSVDSTVAFGTPFAVYDAVCVASSVDPTTAFGTPFAVYDQFLDASSVDPAAAFGTPFAAYDQFLDASSVDPATIVGTPARLNLCVATSVGPFTVVSPAYYEFDQIQYADSVESAAGVGTPVGLKFVPQDPDRTCIPDSLPRATLFGTPVAVPSISCLASSVDPATAFGTPVADALGRTLTASSVDPATALGAPNGVTVHQASPIASGAALGTPTARVTVYPASVGPDTEFGTATVYRPTAYLAYPIPGGSRVGVPTALQRFNYAAASTGPVSQVGTPTCVQRHRAMTLGTVATVGIPTAIRS
jgi:hypothetical protein